MAQETPSHETDILEKLHLPISIPHEQEIQLNRQTAESMHRRVFDTVTGGSMMGSPTKEGYKQTRSGTSVECGTKLINAVEYAVSLGSSQSELSENLSEHPPGTNQNKVWEDVPVALDVELRHPLTGSQTTLPLAKVHKDKIEQAEVNNDDRLEWRILDVTQAEDQGRLATIIEAVNLLEQAVSE